MTMTMTMTMTRTQKNRKTRRQGDPSLSLDKLGTRQGAPFPNLTSFGGNGQIMIEAIVAISMVTIGLLGIITLLISSSRWNRNVGHELVATYLAAEGIEIVKNFIDANIAGRLSGDNMATWNGGLDEDVFYEVQYNAAFGSDGRLPGTPGARQVSPGNMEPLKYDADTHTYGYGSGEESPFRRVVQIVKPAGSHDMLLVSSTVSFEGQDGVQNVHLESVFTHWRKLGSGL